MPRMDNQYSWQAALPAQALAAIGAHATPVLTAQSLTQALRAADARFSVRLLYLGAAPFDALFAGGAMPADAPGWFARDVLLCLNDVPVVWARSMCAAASPEWRLLLDCGTRPLGERLFDGSLPVQRSPFEFALLDKAVPGSGADKGLPARRSFFTLQGETLGLVECFLPALDQALAAR